MSDSEQYLPWAEEFREAYNRRESAMFVLHDNIEDVFPLEGNYVSLRTYLEAMLERGNYIAINYDVSRGMRFVDDNEAKEFLALANQNRHGDDRIIQSIYDFPREPTKALAFIEAFIVGVEASKRPVAVILEYAEHVAPNGDPQHMNEGDRINAVTLQRFARLFYERLQQPDARDAVCFLLTPNLHGLHPDIVRQEVVQAIDVPRPDDEARRRYIKWQQAKFVVEGKPPVTMDVSEEGLVEQTAGLTLTGIRHLFWRAMHAEERKLSTSFVMERKRELIERDSRGMLEIMMPKHGMGAVGGNDAIKEFFIRTAKDLAEGADDVPVGVVCPGPNGVGKTFIAKAFARDSGLNCVSLKNFRGMYVGQTESNLDTIFSILKSMTPNIVIIDEADKMLGNEQSSPGNKVDERVFGAFTAFMGDPEFRGRIFWLLLTARPFNLAPDTGRPGRVEEHVPILAPETPEEKLAVLNAICRSRKIRLEEAGAEPSGESLERVFEALGFVTPAALELICNRARREARQSGVEADDKEILPVPIEMFEHQARCYVPEGNQTKLLLQTIEAVLYTNHLEYLPEPWRSRLRDDAAGLSREREDLQRLVGYA
ncbi:MAG: ATP-binding protein [Polyangiaceae bacterium]